MNADILFDLDRASSSSTSSCRPSAFSNAKTQRRKDAKPTHPPIWPTDHTDKHRWNHDFWLCVARFRPSDGSTHCLRSSGEAPWPSDGHGVTGPRNRLESELSCRFRGPATCALEERRSRHFSSSFNNWVGHAPSPKYGSEERQNRRAPGTSVGEKTGGDECSRSEQAGFSPATGDLLVACRSAGKKRKHPTDSVTAPLRLCVFAPLRSSLGGWAALRLCGSAPLRFFCRSPLVSWCLGGSKTTRHP